MPYMVNANLFYGNIQYMMNKRKFDNLSPEDQKAILEAGRESEEWLKPRYEDWIDFKVGNAVMKGGGAAVSISKDQQRELIDSVQSTWNKEVDEACGVERANKVRALFAKHAS
jgi:TRAP-type C4-dicarboxylate transport system substrate-binding protein